MKRIEQSFPVHCDVASCWRRSVPTQTCIGDRGWHWGTLMLHPIVALVAEVLGGSEALARHILDLDQMGAVPSRSSMHITTEMSYHDTEYHHQFAVTRSVMLGLHRIYALAFRSRCEKLLCT
jgi:hypothetical protein